VTSGQDDLIVSMIQSMRRWADILDKAERTGDWASVDHARRGLEAGADLLQFVLTERLKI